MQHSPSRRTFLLALLATPLLGACAPLWAAPSRWPQEMDLKKQLAMLERQAQGRLGLSLLNTATQQHFSYRGEERFPVCSTFKTLLVAAILRQSMQNNKLLQQRPGFSEQDVQASGYAPVTARHVASGMSIAELCAATIQYSDNAAANVLLKILGGPEALTAFMREVGDSHFRLDRWEPELNSAIPDDLRDTSTPMAMVNSLNKLVLGDALGLTQRAQLADWLKGNTTGDKRIRAGVKSGWQVGDKTGTGAYGTTNDVAIIWPDNAKPLLLGVYFTQQLKDATPREDVIASATRIALQWAT